MTDAELTRLLAEKVMGWVVVERPINRSRHYDFGGPDVFMEINGTFWRGVKADGGCTVPWRPLESMDDAWMVAERLKTRMDGDRYWGQVRTPFDDADQYYAGFTLWGFTGWNGVADFDAIAPTPQRAIVLASLRTCGVEG